MCHKYSTVRYSYSIRSHTNKVKTKDVLYNTEALPSLDELLAITHAVGGGDGVFTFGSMEWFPFRNSVQISSMFKIISLPLVTLYNTNTLKLI